MLAVLCSEKGQLWGKRGRGIIIIIIIIIKSKKERKEKSQRFLKGCSMEFIAIFANQNRKKIQLHFKLEFNLHLGESVLSKF